jgi:hypothetical protein
MKYKPGDWIILGEPGSGWSEVLQGVRVKIADIGPHLKGRLCCRDYDFYVHPNASVPPTVQICRPDGGGLSTCIRGLAFHLENVLKI